MKFSLIPISVLTAIALFSSCAKNSNTDLNHKVEPDQKPQVIDILKGKSKAEVLKMKYNELKATCALNTVKVTRDQITPFSTDITPHPPSRPSESPVANPSENVLTYDLKLQQVVDPELTKDVSTRLTTTKDEQTFAADITFKAVVFQQLINLSINQKKYIMKYTPMLSYTVAYTLVRNGVSLSGNAEGKVYEKIENQQNTIVTADIDEHKYSFVLDCKLDRVINPANADLAAEFESQWAIIDCQSPKNDTERTVCAP